MIRHLDALAQDIAGDGCHHLVMQVNVKFGIYENNEDFEMVNWVSP